MPRKNANVRQRNVPRAAQRQPRKGTQRAPEKSRSFKAPTGQPEPQSRDWGQTPDVA